MESRVNPQGPRDAMSFDRVERVRVEPVEVAAPARFAVLGAGHGGLAMAGHLAISGFSVHLWNRTRERIEMIERRGGILVEGEVEGVGLPDLVTDDLADAIRDVDVIMVVLPAHAHPEIAANLAPLVRPGQTVVLNPGRTGGALQFHKIFREHGTPEGVLLAEAQTFLYISRHLDVSHARIFEVKNEVALAALPAYRTPEVLQLLRPAFPQFIPGDNVLKTGLDNIGAIFHPAVMLLNAGRIESTHGDFEYYLEGVTPAIAQILEAMDRERVAVAEALGIRAHTTREWLYLTYNSSGRNLFEAIQATPGYKGVRAPAHLNHRYILEDVPMSLVPIASLGDMLGVETPTIKAMIRLASIMHGRDFWAEGRTVEALGLRDMSVKEIRMLAVGGDAP